MPTRAAILLFGTPVAIRQMLPRPIVDVQWIQPLVEQGLLRRLIPNKPNSPLQKYQTNQKTQNTKGQRSSNDS